MRKRPTVVLIDDEPDKVSAQAAELGSATKVLLREPDEVSGGDLRAASVVLVDYRLGEWIAKNKSGSLTILPSNGVALVAVLRAYRDSHWPNKRPSAFTIHSGKLVELAGGLPVRSREHAIARTLNLEWVFPKEGSSNSPTLVEQVTSLAEAVSSLPLRWSDNPEDAVAKVNALLAVTRNAWRERALTDVESCHPPAHSSSLATNGLAFLRWLLHQILPYPCFLWDQHYLAARLRVSPDSLAQVLLAERKAQRILGTVRYQGILSDFLGPRWWRTGVEHLLWQWTKGNSYDSDAVKKAVEKHISASLVKISYVRPVVCVDSSFRPTKNLIELEDAVQLQPDDWPTYAEQAWVGRADVIDDPELRVFVVRQDRERVS